MMKTNAGTIALALALALCATACSNEESRAAEALTECIEDAGETPDNAVKAELGPNGEIIVISAPGISAGVTEQCLDDYNSGRLLR